LTDDIRFISSNWSSENLENLLCVFLPRIENSLALQRDDFFSIPVEWQNHIVSQFEQLQKSTFPEERSHDKDQSYQNWRSERLPKYASLLALLESTGPKLSSEARSRISDFLLTKLKVALKPTSSIESDDVHFIVSQGFRAYLRITAASAPTVDTSLTPLLEAALPRFCRSIGFLKTLREYKKRVGKPLAASAESSPGSENGHGPVVDALVGSLTLDSHELRVESLKLLEFLALEETNSSEALDTMKAIEETPLSLANSRTLAMLLRKLGQLYSRLDSNSWMAKAVPSFLFGMTTVKMSPVWDGAVEALQEVGKSKHGEEAITSLAFEWLAVHSARWSGAQQVSHGPQRRFVSDFECTNVNRLEHLSLQALAVVENPFDSMMELFNQQQQTVNSHINHARSQSLKILAAVPTIAEKRSRIFVPRFLEWAGSDDDSEISGSDEGDSLGVRGWSLADRKAMLRVFGHFKNPAALFENQKVYQALLRLLENGDHDMQSLALKAVLTWKQEGVKPYAESLESLLDDSKFKNEVTNLLQGDDLIQPQHRPQLMPILLRLLYGRAISKKGPATGRQGFQSTRLAVLRNLSVEDIGAFLDIATGPVKGIRVVDKGGLRTCDIDREVLSSRRLHGFLNMMSPLISELGTNAYHYMDTLVNSVLYSLFFACRRLQGTVENNDDAEAEDAPGNLSLLKAIRSNGLKCLISLFRNAPDFNWEPYAPFIVQEVLDARIPKLPVETAQGVSGILQLLSTWASLPRAAMFLSINPTIVPQVVNCLAVEKGKDDVKVFALGIIQSLVRLVRAPATESRFNGLIADELLKPVMNKVTENIMHLLQQNTGGILLESCVDTVIDLAPIVDNSESVQGLMGILTRFLQEPSRRINPKVKGRILLVLESLVALQPETSTETDSASLLHQVYESLAKLFSYFKDRENRQALCRVLKVLSTKDASLSDVAELCQQLNSFKEGRINEADDATRADAFDAIGRPRDKNFSPIQWLCLLHNFIFLIEDDDILGILPLRSADGIQRFIEDAASCQDSQAQTAFKEQIETILLPAVFKGIRESSEKIRRQYLRVMSTVVSRMPDWAPVADMQPLLGGDEDSGAQSFFFDLLLASTSKQLDAIRMLQDLNEESQFRSQNISQFLIPLLENFIFGRVDKSDDHGLSAQASSVIGRLAASLEWKHFRSVFLRYSSYIASKPDHQKAVVRLLSQFSDALASESRPAAQAGDDVVEPDDVKDTRRKRLGETIPKQEKLSGDITNNFLPPLVKHLHEKDESEVSYRVPVGVVIIRLFKLLPADEMELKLAPVLTDICHILRSKQDESRDMARDTLVQIALILGSRYFYFILRELRGALRRGYQLHVLSYTLHSILLAVIPEFGQGSLDHCLPSIVAIIMDDIFGVTGQEKDATEYTTTMKEIKSSKSQDSMELISKTASVSHLVELIHPLHALLLQKVDLKMAHKIDTLLTRISTGLLQNPSAESRDTLTFCYEVVQEVYRNQQTEAEPKMDRRTKRYLIPKGVAKTERRVTTKHTYKLVRFAIEVLLKIWKRHDNLRSETYIAGFIPILGDGLVAGEAEVKISVFKLLQAVARVPFNDTEKITGLYKVGIKEATKIIAMSSTTTSEAPQEALKFISVVLRDRRDIEVKEAAIELLLVKVKDDLTDPQYRDITFKFLRSVLDRRITLAAVYDVLDYVGEVLVTNEDDHTRSVARGCFVQFLLDYDQTNKRWTRQLDHIVANLKYDRKEGRLSVMEVIHVLLQKSRESYRQQIASTCFLPLVMVVANDDNKDCRDIAGELVKRIFSRVDKDNRNKFLALLRGWLENDVHETVSMLGLKIFGFYFDSDSDSPKENDLPLVVDKIFDVFGADDIGAVDEDVAIAILDVVAILTKTFPSVLVSSEKEVFWQQARRCMVHPREAVRHRAVNLMLETRAENERPVIASLIETFGSSMTEDLVGLGIRILSTPTMSEELATKTGQILQFLGPKLPKTTPEEAPESSEDEEVDEKEAIEGDESSAKPRTKDLHFLIWKLSYILRKHTPPKSEAVNGKLSSLSVLKTLSQKVPLDSLHSSMKLILVPLYHLTDPAIPTPTSTDEVFKERYGRLKDEAQVLMNALQRKLGAAEYSRLIFEIRGHVRKNREERSRKRKITAVVDPQRYGREKRKKFERKKERRREKGQEHRAARQAFKT